MAKMNWKGMNVLVTGADGFIGSHIAKALADKRANVTTIVRDVKKTSNLDVLNLRSKVNVIHGDLVNFHDCERTINEYDIQFVFHIAAHCRPGEQKPAINI